MEDYHRHCDEVGFNADEAHNIVKECIDGVLGGEDYNQNNINQWTASIVEQSLTHLVKLGKAYKYIVTCAVVQRSAYGFHTASSCFWDTTSDGNSTPLQVSGAATRGQKEATDPVLIVNLKVCAFPKIQTMALLASISHLRRAALDSSSFA